VKRILIADDHELIRAGIKSQVDGNFNICGEASNGQEAVVKTMELKPDLVILDVTMPLLNGLDAARQIRAAAPGTKILLLSMHDPRVLEEHAKTVGADACLSKMSAAHELLSVIEQLIGTTKP
jgi:DNA-binding NarL/FixJ family response regulator